MSRLNFKCTVKASACAAVSPKEALYCTVNIERLEREAEAEIINRVKDALKVQVVEVVDMEVYLD